MGQSKADKLRCEMQTWKQVENILTTVVWWKRIGLTVHIVGWTVSHTGSNQQCAL